MEELSKMARYKNIEKPIACLIGNSIIVGISTNRWGKRGLRNVKGFCQNLRRMGNENPPHLKKVEEEDPAGRDSTFQNSSL